MAHGPPGSLTAHRPLHILVCAPAYPPPALGRGGVQVAVRAQVERLAARGHRLTVVAPYRRFLPLARYAAKRREIPAGPGDEVESERVRILRPRHLHVPGAWRLLDPLAVLVAILAAAAREGRPDLLHGHWLHPHGLAAAVAGRLLGRPVVLTAHGSDVARLAGPAHAAYYRRAMRAAVGHARATICVSRAIADVLPELGAPPGRLHVIPNGVDLERFRPRDRAACRSELGVDPAGRLLVFAGNLVPLKQVDRLLRALAALPDRAVRAAIIGEGPEEPALRALATGLGLADRVRFAGRRPHAEVPLWLAAADLAVLPSASEGMPLVIPEALASGTPVVASRVGGVPECLEDGVTGVLVDPAGVESLAAGLAAALARPWDRDALAAAARRFGWDTIVGEIEGVYARILG